jgi:hypothetical protein
MTAHERALELGAASVDFRLPPPSADLDRHLATCMQCRPTSMAWPTTPTSWSRARPTGCRRPARSPSGLAGGRRGHSAPQ